LQAIASLAIQAKLYLLLLLLLLSSNACTPPTSLNALRPYLWTDALLLLLLPLLSRMLVLPLLTDMRPDAASSQAT